MNKKLVLLVLAACPAAGAITYNIDAGQSSSAIQRVIGGAARGDTISFAAGTYNLTSSLKLKCGITYTGPLATPATAILNATFTRESAMIFNLYSGSGYANPCSQPTTIEYLNFQNTGGIYVQTSFANITITHNQFTNMPCCKDTAADSGIYIDGTQGADNTSQVLSKAIVTWNTFGADPNSCESPTAGAMENWDGKLDVAGNCAAMRVMSSVNGLIFENNKTVHIGEGVAIGCPSPPGGQYPCEPAKTSGNGIAGVTTINVTARYNDFGGVHRIAWEEQPQATSGVDFEFNTYHDPYVPYFGTFDLSFACCENGAREPYLVVDNNVLVQNTPNSPCPSYSGYGIEAHGTRASFSHNMVEGHNGAQFSKAANPPCSTGPYSVPAIAWGFGENPRHYDDNHICGPWFNRQYVVTQNPNYPTPSSIVGNTESSTCSVVVSAAPTISPPGEPQSFPLTVTMTDPGFTSGARPLGNTSIYFTTDGSTPTVNSTLYTGPITLTGPGTVKAIGMWGSGANTKTYPAGYGFAPSAAVSMHYGRSSGGSRR